MKRKVWGVLQGIGIYLGFLLVPSLIAVPVLQFFPEQKELVQIYLENFGTISAALLFLLIYQLCGKNIQQSAGLCCSAVSVSSHLAAFFFGLFGNGAVSFVMTFLPQSWLESYGEQSSQIYDPVHGAISVIGIVLLAPIGEELIFRGMIYRSFRDVLPFGFAAAFSSLMFGAVHVHPVWIGYAFLMGLCFAVMVNRTGSLSISILAHVGFNLASLPNFLLDENSLWIRLVYQTVGGYLAFHGLCILICILIWILFFRKNRTDGLKKGGTAV